MKFPARSILLPIVSWLSLVVKPSQSLAPFHKAHNRRRGGGSTARLQLPTATQNLKLASWQQRTHATRSLEPTSRGSLSRRTSTSTTPLYSSFAIDRAVAVASLSAIAKLLSSIGLGGLASRGRSNVLDASAVSALSRLTYWVFQPAFLLSSVSRTLYSAGTGPGCLPGRFLALMPLTALCQVSMGLLVGFAVTKVAGLSQKENQKVRMSTAFANSGPLPLIMADALFTGSMLRDVSACVSFYLLVWSPLFWSLGPLILGLDLREGSVEKSTGLLSKIRSVAQRILSPPVIGSLMGLVMGLIPFLGTLFLKKGAILAPLFGAVQTLGTAYIPAALLVLAGSLCSRPESTPSTATSTDSSDSVNGVAEETTGPTKRAIASILASRFILAPALSLVILKVLVGLGLLGPLGTRPRAIVTFCLLMEGCMPPNQNSVIMLQLAKDRQGSKTMAQLLTLTYGLAVVPVAVLLSACLGISGIMNFL